MEDDNISIHRGVEDTSSREGSKQGSILSRISGKKKKPESLDHVSLLESGPHSDEDSEEDVVLQFK